MLLGVPAAAGLAALTACTSSDGPPSPPAPPDPDLALRAAAVARERDLIQAYDAALLAVPALADRLPALRAEHLAHLTALGAVPGSPSPTVTPGSAEVQLARLRTAERAAGAGHTAGLPTASIALAVVLATLAASEAAHEVALG